MDQNHKLTPLEKFPFFDFLNFLFLWRRKTFFLLEYCKTHFYCLYFQKKKEFEECPFFNQNHGLTPLEKSQFIEVFGLLFGSLERLFFGLEYRKTHFLSVYCLKTKGWKNGHFLTKTMG